MVYCRHLSAVSSVHSCFYCERSIIKYCIVSYPAMPSVYFQYIYSFVFVTIHGKSLNLSPLTRHTVHGCSCNPRYDSRICVEGIENVKVSHADWDKGTNL